jgi:hypothetical protein
LHWRWVAAAAFVVALLCWAWIQTEQSGALAEELVRVSGKPPVVALEDEMASTVIPAWGYKDDGVCKTIGPTTVTQQPGETLAAWTTRVRETRRALEAEFPPDDDCPVGQAGQQGG